MEIKTKFNVNDLLKRKYDVDPKNTVFALEVMSITSETCYAGTQVFYQCRTILAKKEFELKYQEKGEFTWEIHHAIGSDGNTLGWQRYREDELVEALKETKNIIKNK